MNTLIHLHPHYDRKTVLRWSSRIKRSNPFAGLSFRQKTSDPRATVLISRHWPHLHAWSWGVFLTTINSQSLWGFCRSSDPSPFLSSWEFGLGSFKFIYKNSPSVLHLQLSFPGFALGFSKQDFWAIPSQSHQDSLIAALEANYLKNSPKKDS